MCRLPGDWYAHARTHAPTLCLCSDLCPLPYYAHTGSLIAAAASISKARCEVDAEAATAAATQLAETSADRTNPLKATVELVRLTITALFQQPIVKKVLYPIYSPLLLIKWLLDKTRGKDDSPPRAIRLAEA